MACGVTEFTPRLAEVEADVQDLVEAHMETMLGDAGELLQRGGRRRASRQPSGHSVAGTADVAVPAGTPVSVAGALACWR